MNEKIDEYKKEIKILKEANKLSIERRKQIDKLVATYDYFNKLFYDTERKSKERARYRAIIGNLIDALDILESP